MRHSLQAQSKWSPGRIAARIPAGVAVRTMGLTRTGFVNVGRTAPPPTARGVALTVPPVGANGRGVVFTMAGRITTGRIGACQAQIQGCTGCTGLTPRSLEKGLLNWRIAAFVALRVQDAGRMLQESCRSRSWKDQLDIRPANSQQSRISKPGLQAA